MNRVTEMLALMSTRGSFLRLVVVTLGVVVVFGMLNPQVFLSGENLSFMALASAEVALLAMAISFTMLTAGIDLSVVGIANLSAVIGASMIVDGGGDGAAILTGCLVALAVAAAAGAFNGILIALVGLPPILATLGTGQLFIGLALVRTDGVAVKGLPQAFTDVALTAVAGVPLVFVVMLVLAVVVGLVASRTKLGLDMRLIGANREAAEYSGVSTKTVLISTYLVSGLLSGVAGLIITARASGADSDYGQSYLLLAIVVAVLAGVDPEGGYLTIAGVVIATLALQVMGSGLLSLDVSSHVGRIAQGLLLVVMVALNTWGPVLHRKLWRGRRPAVAGVRT